MSLYCAVALRRNIPAPGPAAATRAVSAALSLWTHVKRAWAPIAGLIVIALLQNTDVIAAKHRLPGIPLQSSYAATAVAAKVLIWVAMGAGFYLVPEVSRRRSEGKDTREVLLKALGIIAVCAVPVLAIFAVAAEPLIRIAFGAKRTHASNSLLPLGAAFTVLACTYLAIQYMLALKRTRFLLVVAAVAIAEPVLLLQASRQPESFASVVLAIQAVGAMLAFAFALRPDRTAPSAMPPPPSAEDKRRLEDPLPVAAGVDPSV
jgi:O-antigen/teichoic acid export membrane protein